MIIMNPIPTAVAEVTETPKTVAETTEATESNEVADDVDNDAAQGVRGNNRLWQSYNSWLW